MTEMYIVLVPNVIPGFRLLVHAASAALTVMLSMVLLSVAAAAAVLLLLRLLLLVEVPRNAHLNPR